MYIGLKLRLYGLYFYAITILLIILLIFPAVRYLGHITITYRQNRQIIVNPLTFYLLSFLNKVKLFQFITLELHLTQNFITFFCKSVKNKNKFVFNVLIDINKLPLQLTPSLLRTVKFIII